MMCPQNQGAEHNSQVSIVAVALTGDRSTCSGLMQQRDRQASVPSTWELGSTQILQSTISEAAALFTVCNTGGFPPRAKGWGLEQERPQRGRSAGAQSPPETLPWDSGDYLAPLRD